MIVLVLRVFMRMRMAMPRAVGMLVLVLVSMERDAESPTKSCGNTHKRREAREMVSALQARDYRFAHPESLPKLCLRFTGVSSEFGESLCAQEGKCVHLIGGIGWARFTDVWHR